jgi:diacylglycerol kinase family enzyme
MKTIFDLCTPREDILKGELKEEQFAARLKDVMDGTADAIYQDPARFFDNTYPTDGLRTLLRIMKPEEGSYVEMDDVHEHDFTWLNVRLESPSPVHTDGEITFESIRELDYRIQPGRLRVFVPG